MNENTVTPQGKHNIGPVIFAAGILDPMDAVDEDIPCVGLAATDIVIVSLKAQAGGTKVVDLVGVAEADNINIKASGIGDSTGVVSYIAIRP